MYSQVPSNTPMVTAAPHHVKTTELLTECKHLTPPNYICLYFQCFDRFAHDDRNPFPSRCRVSCVHRHRRDLRRPCQIRNLALCRVRHNGVRDHAPLSVGRPWRAQPGARIAWRGRRRGSMRRDVPDKQLTVIRCKGRTGWPSETPTARDY